MSKLTYQLKQSDFAAEEKTIRNGIHTHRLNEVGLSPENFVFSCYSGDRMVGGITVVIYGKTLYIRHLWVDEAFRGQDIGTTLMQKVEDTGRGKGCTSCIVDTMSYQADGFYRSLSYREIARIEKFEDDRFDKIFHRKEL